MKQALARWQSMSPQERAALQAAAGAGVDPGPVPGGGSGEASATQGQIWFLDRLSDDAAYVVPFAFRLRGPLDVAALDAALAAVVERHEVLRSRLVHGDGGLRQEPGPGPGPLVAEDVADEEEAWRRARALAAERFDLASGPVVRTRLLRLAPDDSVLVWIAHHAVADGWSAGILLAELAALSSGRALEPLQLQYADFGAWQRTRPTDKALAFWREHLGDAPPAAVPSRRARPATQSFRGDCVEFAVPAGLAEFAAARGTTPFVVLLAALHVLVARYGGEDDAVLGMSLSGRTRPEAEPLIGPLATTLPLRIDGSGDPTVAELLAAVSARVLDGLAHQEIPFGELVRGLGRSRDPGRNPLYQVLFVMGGLGDPPRELAPGLAVEVRGLPNGTARLDLQLNVDATPGGFEARLDYATELFDRAFAERLVAGYTALLRGFLADPDAPVSALSLLGPDERDAVLTRWTDLPDIPAPDGFLPLFAASVASWPGRIALSDDDGGDLTYRELDERSDAVARAILARHAGGGVVAVAAPHTADQLAGLLGVLKAGSVYLPLDPELPGERRDFVLADSGAELVLHAGALPGGLRFADLADLGDPEAPLPPTPGPHDPAYLMYTSGSTGRPKGVLVRHGALGNFLAAMSGLLRPDDAVPALTSPTFDISLDELLLPLVVGARTVVVPRAVARDGAALLRLVEKEGVTVLHGTPATFRLLVDAGWDGGGVRAALCGGEALPARLAAELTARAGEVWNLFGPTEATVWALTARVDGSGAPPIGTPLPNMTALALDAALRPVPPDALGELYLAGAGLADGYHGRPELTAERFITGPGGLRLYRTGDLVRYDDQGVFWYHGRVDDQVKLRGFRIELGEIEATLLRHPDVVECAVVVHERNEDDRRLVAYFRGAADPRDLTVALRAALPPHMVPALLVAVDALPRTTAGKTDRRALAARALPDVADGADHTPPRTPVEKWLAAQWADLLGRGPIGAHDDFFALGGHSLLAVRVLGQIADLYGVELSLEVFFARPTVAALAARVAAAEPAAADDLLARVEELTDEEVARLLGGEETP
ncbi:amino acid adenylation domain-containing protein [Actinocorallia sp. API 0066]|uniref:non-ribosomal peptide synthetase n=1 Tax=Actinocorallia sp. API 0066 TaxID=2896846 RepID=UPI001E50499B|nr:non-ribosomal peptide synthetase [Actinocorallia sp. API 0066]MCD0447745.1 amino acid adenylation domain-containing protein [Actinocorallia sp. API 0066]